jgi:Cell wall-associated hydrolases (invasion-associated proteins)
MLTHGICHLTLIPVREEASERSEMVTQLLFGETVDVLESSGSWSFIRTHFDDYKGWVTSKMLTKLTEDEYNTFKSSTEVYIKEAVCSVSAEDPQSARYLAGGSTLYEKDNQIIAGSNILTLDPKTTLHRIGDVVDIVETAYKFLNSPYLWGGRSAFGIDCSGFTQIVFKMNGLTLPRDAYQQTDMGKVIDYVKHTQPGDLAFFENEKGRITHTGIVLENNEIIHASGKVRIDKLDQQGILNVDAQEYSHKLSNIRRILD